MTDKEKLAALIKAGPPKGMDMEDWSAEIKALIDKVYPGQDACLSEEWPPKK